MSNSRSEVNPIVSASGDDEELKELLAPLRRFAKCRVIHGGYPTGTTCLDCERICREHPERYGDPLKSALLYAQHRCEGCLLKVAIPAIESLFGRIREERDRLSATNEDLRKVVGPDGLTAEELAIARWTHAAINSPYPTPNCFSEGMLRGEVALSDEDRAHLTECQACATQYRVFSEAAELIQSRAELGRIREELKEARKTIDNEEAYAKTCVKCRALAVTMGVCFSCGFIQNAAQDLIARLEAENESLRSSFLTPIQAEVCLIGLRQFTEMPDDDPLLEKLRLISGGALKEGATQ